ncbi:glutamate tRS [Acrasis kona]|uniref:Glutamate tRS n=1 Tax=Acrasis kona TaxID=1008807 RepID=A0AAW2ZP71_9EUKA
MLMQADMRDLKKNLNSQLKVDAAAVPASNLVNDEKIVFDYEADLKKLRSKLSNVFSSKELPEALSTFDYIVSDSHSIRLAYMIALKYLDEVKNTSKQEIYKFREQMFGADVMKQIETNERFVKDLMSISNLLQSVIRDSNNIKRKLSNILKNLDKICAPKDVIV